MTVVTLQVSSLDEVKKRAARAFRGEKQGARITFASPELLFKLLTAKRWELIRTMTGAGAKTIREAARRSAGTEGRPWRRACAARLRRTEKGLIVFPFDAVHVDVTLRA